MDAGFEKKCFGSTTMEGPDNHKLKFAMIITESFALWPMANNYRSALFCHRELASHKRIEMKGRAN
jgi:hypothetical protein